jgi:hypothetical protein
MSLVLPCSCRPSQDKRLSTMHRANSYMHAQSREHVAYRPCYPTKTTASSLESSSVPKYVIHHSLIPLPLSLPQVILQSQHQTTGIPTTGFSFIPHLHHKCCELVFGAGCNSVEILSAHAHLLQEPRQQPVHKLLHIALTSPAMPWCALSRHGDMVKKQPQMIWQTS